MQRLIDLALDQAAADGGLDVVDDLSFPATFGTMAYVLGVGTHEAHACRQATLDIGRALRPSATDADIAGANRAFDWYVDLHPRPHRLQARPPGRRDAGRVPGCRGSRDDERRRGAGDHDALLRRRTPRQLLPHPQRDPADARAPRPRPHVFATAPEERMQLIAEILRIDTPEQFVTRYVTEDIDVDGTVLPAGAVVILMIGSGNHDQLVFDEPGQFRSGRPDIERLHLAFSGGQHGCAGQVLARAQGDIAISSLFRRFPGCCPRRACRVLAHRVHPRHSAPPGHRGLTHGHCDRPEERTAPLRRPAVLRGPAQVLRRARGAGSRGTVVDVLAGARPALGRGRQGAARAGRGGGRAEDDGELCGSASRRLRSRDASSPPCGRAAGRPVREHRRTLDRAPGRRPPDRSKHEGRGQVEPRAITTLRTALS